MSRFNVGDLVKETSSGDVGIITKFDKSADGKDNIYVKWQTGGDSGLELWIWEQDIELQTHSPVSSVQQAIDFLVSQGYTVSLSR